MKICTVYKDDRIVNGMVLLPASKSISNRLLIIRALSEKGFRIANLSAADDTALLAQHLDTIKHIAKGSSDCTIDTHNAGTVMRFLTAYLAGKPGRWTLVGTDRMHERPIAPLVEALTGLGADIEYLASPGYPPLRIEGKKLNGGVLDIDASVSSQFVSALLMIAPSLPGGLELRLARKPVSLPYIQMTISLMQACGIQVIQRRHSIVVKPGEYKGKRFSVEADWSSAAFWYEAVALADQAELYLPGLQQQSLQGDAIVAEIFRQLGVESHFDKHGLLLSKDLTTSHRSPVTCHRSPVTSHRSPVTGHLFTFDFTEYPDIAPAVITTCAALGIHSAFQGLKGLNIKETNRIAALTNELRKVGLILEVTEGGDRVDLVKGNPGLLNHHANMVLESYDDHRMAMTFAPLALKLGSIRIASPDVVSKSYPGFWEEMKQVGFKIRET